MPFAVAFTVFVLGLTTLAALYAGLARRPRGSWQSARFAGVERLAPPAFGLNGTSGRLFAWWVRRTVKAERDGSELRRTHVALSRAGYAGIEQLALYRALRIAAFFALIAAGLVVASFYPRWRIPALLGGAVVGYLLPGYAVGRLMRRRQRIMLHELPAILDLLVVTLEAGQGLQEAIRIVGRETSRQGRALGRELATAGAEMGAGLSLETAMINLAERTGVDELKSLAALLIQSKEIGGRLGPSLRAAAELLNSKRRLKAEESAQKSSVKMLLPLVLLILPAMMLIILGPAVIQILQLIMGATA